MLEITMGDVVGVLKSCAPYIITFGVVLVLGIIAMIACGKCAKSKRYLIRTQAGIAMVLALVIVANLICTGPMKALVSLATGNGTVSEATSDEAMDLIGEIADEGIVLLENDGALPLGGNAKVNVFGWSSVNPCYGGTGSGSINDLYPITSLLEGLQKAGISTNEELSNFYASYVMSHGESVNVGGVWTQNWNLPETPVAQYGDGLISNAKAFSDTAMIVLSRIGGEGNDLPQDMLQVSYENNSDAYDDFKAGEHFLQLSQSERNMIDLVTENFAEVILVYNGANTFELDFIQEYPQIKSVVWCPGPGQNGFEGLGRILTGEVNPSGKTVDTFVRDLTTTPYFANCGDFTYADSDKLAVTATNPNTGITATTVPHFVNYNEGIYVGYKFYETAAVEGLIAYDEMVQYPFGYGLTYTSFTQEMGELTEQNGMITLEVAVTNTGDVAGKDVVQVYYQPPYTNGGIEKSAVNLADFAKTGMLQPGESETITISFNMEEMASYDTYGESCYVLEQGDYVISINSDSHTILNSRTYTVADTVVYDESNPRASDDVAATNQFGWVEGDGEITYLSRKDGFANYAAATAAPVFQDMPGYVTDGYFHNGNYIAEEFDDPNDVMPTTGEKNGIMLAELRGKDYDDPMWDSLLDQLTFANMNDLITMDGYQTAALPGIGKVNTVDCDGPASINNNFTGAGSVGFPCAVMVASTWNVDLAEAFGDSIGKMAGEMGVSGWYAPSMNTHRTAFGGRNFEYYSEDGVLGGKIAAAAVAGAKGQGVYSYIKHFALNDQESNRRNMICTWSNEQAIREIYLKPFELSVKEGGAQAVMSSVNYIGNRWAGGCDSLLNKVLRDEWGFRGFVLSDYFIGGAYMDVEIAIRNGNDACLATFNTGYNSLNNDSATAVLAARQACKNIMYTVVNSRAYAPENLKMGPQSWQIALVAIDVVLAAAFIAIELLVVRKGYGKRKKRENAVHADKNISQ